MRWLFTAFLLCTLPAHAEEQKIYEAFNGWTIAYPADWTVRAAGENGTETEIFTPPGGKASVTAVIHPVNARAYMTAKNLLDFYDKVVPVNNLDVIEKEARPLLARDFGDMLVSASVQSGVNKSYMFFVNNTQGDKFVQAYVFVAVPFYYAFVFSTSDPDAFGKYSPEVEKMAASFKPIPSDKVSEALGLP